MGDWPSAPSLGDACLGGVSPASLNSLGPGFADSGVTSYAWPAANRALFVPFRLSHPETVFKLACGAGALTAGNFDIGVYSPSGARLVSTGSTPKSAASTKLIVDVADTPLGPGMYYLAMSVDTASAAYVGYADPTAFEMRMFGVRQMSSIIPAPLAEAFPLPAQAVFESVSSAGLPIMAAYLRS